MIQLIYDRFGLTDKRVPSHFKSLREHTSALHFPFVALPAAEKEASLQGKQLSPTSVSRKSSLVFTQAEIAHISGT